MADVGYRTTAAVTAFRPLCAKGTQNSGRPPAIIQRPCRLMLLIRQSVAPRAKTHGEGAERKRGTPSGRPKHQQRARYGQTAIDKGRYRHAIT